MLKYSALIALWLPAILLIANGPSTVFGRLNERQLQERELKEPGDAVLLWNDEVLNAVRSLRLGAFDAARAYGILNVAMFDAANGLDGPDAQFRYALVEPASGVVKGNKVAAVSSAASNVLSQLFPDSAIHFENQLNEIKVLLSRVGVKQNFIKRGEKWGSIVGNAVFKMRSDDGSTPKETLTGSGSPGNFRNDFGSAAFRNMDSIVVDDPLAYASAGPPALTSPEYLAAHTEVRLLGNANYENSEYDEIFSFWKAGGGSVRPPGEWIKIAQIVAKEQGTVESLSKTTLLFGALSIALADTSIAVAFDKFTYQFWRPATAIQNADTDGNDTVQDSAWAPRNGSNGSSPEHTSGQSAFAGAASTILAEFFGTDNIQFTAEGDNSIAGGRTYASFSDAAREAGRSRIFSGIHFEFSNQAGQATGRGVAREVIEWQKQ